jgi:hypothetical protein
VTPAQTANAVRFPASAFPSIAGLTLLPHGAQATLVNLSATGLLCESTARLQVSSPVLVQFRGSFTPGSVVGRIVRCEVTAMGKDGLLRYGIAIEFASPIRVGDSEPAPPPAPSPQTAQNRW